MIRIFPRFLLIFVILGRPYLLVTIEIHSLILISHLPTGFLVFLSQDLNDLLPCCGFSGRNHNLFVRV